MVIIVLGSFVPQSLCGCYSYHCRTHTQSHQCHPRLVSPCPWNTAGAHPPNPRSNGGVKICSAATICPQTLNVIALSVKTSLAESQFGQCLIRSDPSPSSHFFLWNFSKMFSFSIWKISDVWLLFPSCTDPLLSKLLFLLSAPLPAPD